MLGSIIGDIVGSAYEFANIKTKDFPFFSNRDSYTDDSILSVATADWLLHGGNIARLYSDYAARHPFPMGGYGGSFQLWVVRSQRQGDFRPYNSCGNGSAMRVGPVGWAFDTKEETLAAAKRSAECTHNHPEGIKGAQATALCIFMARHGASKDEIRKAVENEIGYNLNFTCESIRPTYTWGGTCQTSVPQAIVAFLDGTDFEDCIRNAVSIGGDSDTISCITGSIAEAFFGIGEQIRECAMTYLPDDLITVINEFETKYGGTMISSTTHKTKTRKTLFYKKDKELDDVLSSYYDERCSGDDTNVYDEEEAMPWHRRKSRVTPAKIERLARNEIFVFGSNAMGMHKGGAARFARKNFGAKMGHPRGLQGQSYAIPTVGLAESDIEREVLRFCEFAEAHSELTFFVTPVGCGIAGFVPDDIAPMFRPAVELENVLLPESFWKVLK